MGNDTLHKWQELIRAHCPPDLPACTPPATAFLHWVEHSPSENCPAPRFEDDALWQRVLRNEKGGTLPISDTGPLFHECQQHRALEVWTECELSGLQAMLWIAMRRESEPLLLRAVEAASWHLENSQPDNATNHPWGIPVFVLLSVVQPSISAEAELYAGTLLHNCLVANTPPEPLSAHILNDAQNQLDAMQAADFFEYMESTTRSDPPA
jgi:hypothetical protein